jgi:hypothetical protein
MGIHERVFTVGLRATVGVMAALALVHCGSSNSPLNGPQPGLVDKPTAINLIPVQSGTYENRLIVMVTGVGGGSVHMPLAFDTGSAGISLYALDVLPPSIVTSAGFSFPEGQSSVNYAGITVTNQQAVRTYGGLSGKSEIGNIGFAQITFGDKDGQLTTAVMPVFLYYLITENATGEPTSVPFQRGWFGVNASADLIKAGTAEPEEGYPACGPDVIGSCYVVSVLKYLQYGSNVHAGFSLSPSELQQNCTIGVDCVPKPMLTVGLTPAAEASFSSWDLQCPPSDYPGPSPINGFPVCTSVIPNTTVTVTGSSPGTYSGNVLFDSGTPTMILNVPKGFQFPGVGPTSTVTVMTPSGFDYQFQAEGAIAQAPVGPYVTGTTLNSTAATIVGVGFFSTNGFFIDFADGTEGWR